MLKGVKRVKEKLYLTLYLCSSTYGKSRRERFYNFLKKSFKNCFKFISVCSLYGILVIKRKFWIKQILRKLIQKRLKSSTGKNPFCFCQIYSGSPRTSSMGTTNTATVATFQALLHLLDILNINYPEASDGWQYSSHIQVWMRSKFGRNSELET